MVGKRQVGEIVNSRPASVASKCGKRGQQIVVQANYFRLLKKPEWCIHQYRVDFIPDTASQHQKRNYLNDHTDIVGSHVFDGETVFSTSYFVSDDNGRILELWSRDRNGTAVLIKLKHVGIVDCTDFQHLQILNIILRYAIEKLHMQLVGRHYYDASAKVVPIKFKNYYDMSVGIY